MKGSVRYFYVVLGGPFEPRIEYILRNRAALMNAPIISPFGLGIHNTITKLDSTQSQPCQYADILIKLDENDPNTVRDGVIIFDMEAQLPHFQCRMLPHLSFLFFSCFIFLNQVNTTHLSS